MQKIKSMIKKIGAISFGAVMLGSTMGGALAASLADYPSPFVDLSGKKYDYLMVLGGDSKVDDTIGALDIAGGLGAAKVPGTSSGGGTTSVSGGRSEDVPIGSNIAATNQLDKDLDDSDISNLLDSTVNFQGSDYDISEVVELGQVNNMSVQTSLAGPLPDDNYKDKVVMVALPDSIKYYYSFDESIQVNKTKSSDALDIKFLGKTLKITSIDGTSKFTANVGAQYYLQAGDAVTVNSKEVKLVDVGSGGSIIVSVAGVQDTISASSTKTINGVEIKNDDTFYTTKESSKSAAWIVAGKDATETYTDGDAYVGENKDDPSWIWDIGNLNTVGTTSISNNVTNAGMISTGSGVGPFIGIELDHSHRYNGDDPAVEVGKCIDLPSNYVSVCLGSLTVSGDDMSLIFESGTAGSNIDLSEANVPTYTASTFAKTIHIKSGNDGIKLLQSALGNLTKDTTTEEVWLTGITNVSVFYKNHDNSNKKTFAGNTSVGTLFAGIINGGTKDTNLQLNATAQGGASGYQTNGEILLTLQALGDTTNDLAAGQDDLYMNWSRTTGGFNSLGTTQSSEEGAELRWGPSQTNIGTKNTGDLRTKYGVVVKEPKSSGANDKVQLMIPSDQVQANVEVRGNGAVSSGGVSTGGIAVASYAGPAPGAVKDTEVGSTAGQNLILVGGPAVNKLSAQFLGLQYPAYGAASGLSPGEAIISWKDNSGKAALVVAGWEGTDTQRASRVLRDYQAYKTQLMGSEVKVTGTTSAPTVVSSPAKTA